MKLDYTKILDDEILKFIQNTENFYSESDDFKKSIFEVRSSYNKMCEFFNKTKPYEVISNDLLIKSTPIRHYKKASNNNKNGSVVYFHGGGFTLGGLESHDSFCSEICSLTSLQVFSVDYKLAPEYSPYQSLNECMEIIKWYEQSYSEPYVLAGDSAGGWIAANITHLMRHDLQFLNGQLLIYPALGGEETKGSYITHSDAPLLSTGWIISNRKKYFEENNFIDDKYFPLKKNDFHNLPPTIVFVAECDPLSDDGIIYVNKLKHHNNKAKCFIERGLVHSYIRAIHVSKKAKKSLHRIAKGLTSLSNSDWPY